MTTLLPGPTATRGPGAAGRITWARVDEGFHVASRAGAYVGFAERTESGDFLGFDGRSTRVGRFATLAQAQRAVEAAELDAVVS